MKKHYYTRNSLPAFFLLFCCLQANAQIEAGLWFAETSVGNFLRQHTKYDEGNAKMEDTYSTVSLFPVIGYMAGNNVAFGLRLRTDLETGRFQSSELYYDYRFEGRRSSISIAPFMRLYFPTSHYRTRPYIQLGGGKGFMSTREEYTLLERGAVAESESYTRHDEFLQIDAELGLNYLISPAVAISSGVGYYIISGKFDYNVQRGGSFAQQSFTRRGTSSGSAMLWRLGFAWFI